MITHNTNPLYVLRPRRSATSAEGLKKTVRRHIAPFNQRQKTDSPSLTLLGRNRHTRGQQLIHLCFDRRTLAKPMLEGIALPHVTHTLVGFEAAPLCAALGYALINYNHEARSSARSLIRNYPQGNMRASKRGK